MSTIKICSTSFHLNFNPTYPALFLLPSFFVITHYLDCFYSRSVELYFSLSHLLKCGTIFKFNASFFFLSQHLQTQYDSLFPTLCNDHPDIFPREVYTWEQFLWACELWYLNSMQVMFPDGKLRTCLIPIAGFLNHSVCHSCCSPFFFIFHIHFSLSPSHSPASTPLLTTTSTIFFRRILQENSIGKS